MVRIYIASMDNNISNTKFRFIPNTNKQLSNGNYNPGSINYFQIASFANPHTNKYHLKRFMINENNQFIGIKEYHLKKCQLDKFILTKKQNEYKMFSSYSLSNISYPNNGDISMARSQILEEDSLYSGYAKF